AVLEIAVGAQPFMDIVQAGGSFTLNGYNTTLAAGIGPLGGRAAWSRDSGGWLITEARLPPSASHQNIQLRWRFASVGGLGGNGWFVDDVAVSEYLCRPRLSISLTATNTAVASWLAPSTGWILQQNTNLLSGAWENWTNSIGVVGGRNQI